MVDIQYVPCQLMLGRLLMAVAAGAIVGQERERRDQPAGLRTHVLVSTGACLFTLISISLAGDEFDPGRVAAGVITGIGFLGAGTIIRYGGSVRGLTTAASIWAVSGVGMAAGIGWWQAVLPATLLLYLCLTVLKLLERKYLYAKRGLTLQVQLDESRMSVTKLRSELACLGHELSAFEVTYDDDTETSLVTIELDPVPPAEAAEIVERLAKAEGVRSVRAT